MIIMGGKKKNEGEKSEVREEDSKKNKPGESGPQVMRGGNRKKSKMVEPMVHLQSPCHPLECAVAQ